MDTEILVHICDAKIELITGLLLRGDVYKEKKFQTYLKKF